MRGVIAARAAVASLNGVPRATGEACAEAMRGDGGTLQTKITQNTQVLSATVSEGAASG